MKQNFLLFLFHCPQIRKVQVMGLPGGPVAMTPGDHCSRHPSVLASGRRGLPSVVVHGLLTAVASLPWLPCRGTRTSAVVEHALCCSTAYGAFPAQGLNPCPLQWQADSYPPHHQGSPTFVHGLFFWGVGGRFSTVFQSRGLDTTQWP